MLQQQINTIIFLSLCANKFTLLCFSFMYTGRLEFRDSLTKKLYYTAGRLNMPVLTKLLDAQGASDVATEASTPTYKSATPAILSKSQNNSFAKKNASKELPEMLPGRK
jgi:hypothetical protein